MRDKQLRACIEKPLWLAGTPGEETRQLADEILRDSGDQPGDLALVEMALFKTWQQRHEHQSLLNAYKAIGRVEGVLQAAAEEALHKFQAQPRRSSSAIDTEKLAETVFVRLVSQSAGGGVTRRVVSRAELCDEAWLMS